MMRNRWQDKDDVIITLLQKTGPAGNMHSVFDFTAEGGTDPEGTPLRFAWRTSDGQTATEPKAQFRFAKPGRYDVFLTVTDGTDLQMQFVADGHGAGPISAVQIVKTE